jgi:hypothetical protein
MKSKDATATTAASQIRTVGGRPGPAKAAPTTAPTKTKPTKTKPTKIKPTKTKPTKAKPTKKPSALAIRNTVDAARKNLRSLTATIEQANDRDAEQILGEGRLEALLKAVLPARKRSNKTTYDYLASQKRRASLMARLRHSINTTYSFPVDTLGRVLSPTRVQWFYDGLTFIEGSAPFSGVVGLYRNGQLSYGMNVRDASENASLGPVEADFVTVDKAKQSFDSASKSASESEAALRELMAEETGDEAGAPERWIAVLEHFPWVLGAQHSGLIRVKQDDSRMPGLFLTRVSDGASDILLLGQPSTSIFGRSGRLQRSFQDTLQQAEQTLSFVGRQADYLEREFEVQVHRPRAFVLAGRRLTRTERDALRQHVETRHADLRVLTLQDLAELAQQTRSFFEERF